MDVRKRLGLNVRRLRENKKLSQEAFAEDAGIHRTYVSDIERGARNPTITVVEKLASGLGVTASDLLRSSALRKLRLDLGSTAWCVRQSANGRRGI